MRLFELTEAISTTPLKTSLKKEINSQILDSAHQIYYKEPQLDQKIKNDANENVTLSKITPFTNQWLKEQLTVRISAGVESIIKAFTGVNSSVAFDDIKTGGYASFESITISKKHIDEITKEVSESVYDVTLDNLENEHKIVEALFRSYKNLDLRDLYGRRSNLDRIVADLITVIIHELTHVLQHSTQFKQGRNKTEYRSYIEPDKKKFHAVIDKMHKGEALTPDEYKIYYGSPQEIGAFAQDTALKVIDDMYLDEVRDMATLKELIQDIPAFVRGYIDNRFNNPSNPKEHKVFKRFHKLLYQEVMRYVEAEAKRIIKRIKKNNAG